MSDTRNLQISKNDWNGLYVPKHTAKLIKAGIESNTAPFLPVDGGLKPSLVFNANTGFSLGAKDLIPVLLVKAEKEYESCAVGTFKTVGNARTAVKAGEKGIFYNFKDRDGDGEFHHSAYFFGEQTEQPERFKEFAEKNLKQKRNLSNETLKITSPEVTEYLGAYVAACKSGAKVDVSPEIAEQFKANILAIADNELKRTNAEKNPAIPKMTDILLSVEKKSNEIVRSLETEKGLVPGQRQEQTKKNVRKIDRDESYSF